MKDYFPYILDDKEMTQVFDIAHKIWLQNRNKHVHKAIAIGSVRLYSYAAPSLELPNEDSFWNHFSPSRIRSRLRHADSKDILYFDPNGNILRPGLEIRLPSPEVAYYIRAALAPLTPAHFPLLSQPWRIVIQAITTFLTIRRRLAGEQVLAFYCAEDRTYFGSVYLNPDGQFLTIHGRTSKIIQDAVRKLQSIAELGKNECISGG